MTMRNERPRNGGPRFDRSGRAGGRPPGRGGYERGGRAPRPSHRVPTAREGSELPRVEPLKPTSEFIEAAAAQGIEFEDGDLGRLGTYLALLLAVNETTNLTAITDPALAWMRHVFDSLTLIPMLAALPEGASVIDVGSGGGLPGVPLAICVPAVKFTLLEATGKKTDFLRGVVGALGLSNVRVVAERAEVAAQDRGERGASGREGGHREAYDAVMARAVGRLPTLLELTVPFAKIGAPILLIKGEQAATEVEEAKGALHLLKAVHVDTIATPTGRVVVIEKGASTPKLYPRGDGEPKRVPLGVERKEEGRERKGKQEEE